MTVEQRNSALMKLQALIVQARHQAFDVGADAVGELLDDIELLPFFIAENRDADFDIAIDGVRKKYLECSQRFTRALINSNNICEEVIHAMPPNSAAIDWKHD